MHARTLAAAQVPRYFWLRSAVVPSVVTRNYNIRSGGFLAVAAVEHYIVSVIVAVHLHITWSDVGKNI
jgi:hypothetical protein